MPPTLDLAAELALRLAGANDGEIDAVVTEALGTLAEHAAADRCYIMLYHDDGTFENSHEWTPDGVVPQLPAIKRLRSNDFRYSYELALSGQVLAAPDLLALPDDAAAEKDSFSQFGVQAVLQVPIVVNGEGIGLIGFNNFEVVQPWSDDLIEFVSRVGQVIGVVLMRQRAIEGTRRALDQAARANRLKDEFLSHVSHELRNPLHAILGYAELMELDHRSEQDREALLQIQFNGRHLLTMVEDLIGLSRGTDHDTDDIPVRPAVDAAVDSLGKVAASRRITLELGANLDGSSIHTDAGRLRQVLYCVLSGGIQAVGNGGSVGIDVVDDATVRIRLDGTDALDEDVVMPMARALIDGHGEIAISSHTDHTVDVDVRFDTPR